MDHMDQLRRGLAGLPTPKNDYEIVVPEDEAAANSGVSAGGPMVEDQSDVDARVHIEAKRKHQEELKLR